MTADRELQAWLRLCLTPGLSPSSVRRLLSEFGSPDQALSADRETLDRCVGKGFHRDLHSSARLEMIAKAVAWKEKPGCRIVTLADAEYPRMLLQISDPPNLLYAIGNLTLLGRPGLAVVGSRNATAQGMSTAESFSRAFSEAGLTVVSGLALGIDAAAHRGALAAEGSTIAVLGTGIDISYPSRNTSLYHEIASHGLLVSEYPLGTPPLAQNFPRRNRIISGLSKGCLVVEAAMGSGSLITARTAADQGRDVFALPGSIHSPLSRGCHSLIKQGAKLVDSVDDVLAELGHWRHGSTVIPDPLVDEELLLHMGFDPVDMDILCARAGMLPDKIHAELLRLELDGRIATLPGGRYQRLS